MDDLERGSRRRFLLGCGRAVERTADGGDWPVASAGRVDKPVPSDARSPRKPVPSAAPAGVAVALDLSVGRAAHAAGSDQIRFALVGCGARGAGAAGNLLDVKGNLKLIALADAFVERAQGALADLKRFYADQIDVPRERIFVGLESYREAIACDVDLVILATPPGFRPAMYQAAVEAGKHVFMEKPCCTDAPGFRTVMEANRQADQKGLKVGVGFQRRHANGYRQAVQEIREGKIGDVVLLRTYSNGGSVPPARRKPDMGEMEHQIRNWAHFVWLSGDSILFFHVHQIDVANWVKDDHPIEAHGMGGRRVRATHQHGQIFDHHVVEFTYRDGTKLLSQCRQIPGCWNTVEEHALGTKGSLCLSAFRRAGRGANNPYVQQYVDLVAAIRSGAKYHEGWHGATSSFTAILGRMATYSGQVVRWDEAAAQGPSEMPDRLAWDAQPKALPDAESNYPAAMPGVYKPY